MDATMIETDAYPDAKADNATRRIDAYIAAAAPFAQPILRHIRAAMHRHAPEAVEAIKWSMPFFTVDGRPLANMAAFKAHASFGFWRRDGAGPEAEAGEGMGQFGKLTSVADLPDDAEFGRMVCAAVALIDAGVVARRPPKAPKPEFAMPDDLGAALAASAAGQAAFDGFPPGARREYVEWVVAAKQPATRARRVATAVAQCAEGKRLHWKYANC